MNNKHEMLAMEIFYRGGNIQALLDKFGMVLIDGKTTGNLVDAFNTGLIEGGGKFEREMSCAARRLEKVCKVKS